MSDPGTLTTAPDADPSVRPDTRPVPPPADIIDTGADGSPVSYTISESGLRKQRSRTKRGRRHIVVWPCKDDLGKDHYLVRLQTGPRRLHLVLDTETIHALSALHSELSGWHTVGFKSWIVKVDLPSDGSEAPRPDGDEASGLTPTNQTGDL